MGMNNRMLWCLKQYASSREDEDVYARVLVWPLARGVLFNGEEVCEQFCRVLTTRNEGTSVKLRFAECELHLQHEVSVASMISSTSSPTAELEPVAALSPEEAVEIAGE